MHEESRYNHFGPFVAAALATFSAQAETFRGVTIAAETNSNTYQRSLYKHWTDADNDDMNTRHEVLEQESLVPVTLGTNSSNDPVVTGGLWVGPYTGLVTTDPRDLEVDHMVPLKEAHESGAGAWDADKKERYANDMIDTNHLIAVKGGSNGSKGARDPADWMPPNRSYWCAYLTNWMAIKLRWELTMDEREVEAVRKGFQVCDKYRSGDHLDGRH